MHSNKSPAESDVHATLAPRSGLSGLLRRLAFRYTKSGFGNWFPLIFANRINIWEGLVKDSRDGLIPYGLISELKYNKRQFITRTAAKALVTVLAFALFSRGSRKKYKRK
jgi:hypothetical protein